MPTPTPRLATLLLAACASSGAAFGQSRSAPTTLPAPAFAVGDRWTYRESDLLTQRETDQIRETVASVDAANVWIESQRRARSWWRWDAKNQAREQFESTGPTPTERGRVWSSVDGGCAYPYPLSVGQKFSCTERVNASNGWKLRYELRWEVEAAESIDTPAGRFDSLRLKAQGWSNNESNNTSSRHERTVWLSSAAKREVKHQIRTILNDGTPFRVEGRELTALQLTR